MTNFELTLKKLRNCNVTLDCNVLLLFVIGSIGKEHLKLYKRTQIFIEEDYDLLVKLIYNSKVILTTNVISEASNLLESYSYKGQKIGLLELKRIIQETTEQFTESNVLVDLNSYLRFGISDSSLDYLCQNKVVAITIDLNLYGYLISQSYYVINFNHIRTELTLK